MPFCEFCMCSCPEHLLSVAICTHCRAPWTRPLHPEVQALVTPIALANFVELGSYHAKQDTRAQPIFTEETTMAEFQKFVEQMFTLTVNGTLIRWPEQGEKLFLALLPQFYAFQQGIEVTTGKESLQLSAVISAFQNVKLLEGRAPLKPNLYWMQSSSATKGGWRPSLEPFDAERYRDVLQV